MKKLTKTKSAYLKSPWQFEVREVDLPDEPPEGEALLRVEACGICGTDLTNARANTAEWKPFGHEIAGVIELVPEGNHGLKPGDKVVLESSSYPKNVNGVASARGMAVGKAAECFGFGVGSA